MRQLATTHGPEHDPDMKNDAQKPSTTIPADNVSRPGQPAKPQATGPKPPVVKGPKDTDELEDRNAALRDAGRLTGTRDADDA